MAKLARFRTGPHPHRDGNTRTGDSDGDRRVMGFDVLAAHAQDMAAACRANSGIASSSMWVNPSQLRTPCRRSCRETGVRALRRCILARGVLCGTCLTSEVPRTLGEAAPAAPRYPHFESPQFKQVVHPSIITTAAVLHLAHSCAPSGKCDLEKASVCLARASKSARFSCTSLR